MTIRAVAHVATLWVLWHLPLPSPPGPIATWRLYTNAALHVGIRPAYDFGNGVGLTVQVSTTCLP